MAKRRKGFKSDDQRKAVMAILRKAGFLGKPDPPLGGLIRLTEQGHLRYLGEGASRQVWHHPESKTVFKVSMADDPRDQARHENKFLKKYGGTRFEVRFGGERYKVRFPRLHYDDDSVSVVEYIKGGKPKRNTSLHPVYHRIGKRFKLGDVHRRNTRHAGRKKKTIWIIDTGVPRFGGGRSSPLAHEEWTGTSYFDWHSDLFTPTGKRGRKREEPAVIRIKRRRG